jgi:SHS2 domain-containing protein
MIFNQPNIEGLLVDFLSELLYLFDGEGLIILDPELHITGGSDSISLKISSNTYSYIIPPEYSGIEIKAITHHDIDISEIDSGYRARFLVDI